MSEEESTTDWAQLVCVTDTDTPPFLIAKDKFTIGRARGCDISHEDNKLVSGSHCYILRDESGKVWLYDTSTNGTLLNSKVKLSKGECRELQHGDEFFVVHKKGEEELSIGYVFQDLARLKEEEEDDSGDLDQTLEYEDAAPQIDSTIADDHINEVEEEEARPTVKRKRTPPRDPDPGPSNKRTKGSNSEADSTSDIVTATTAPTATNTTPSSDTAASKDEEPVSEPCTTERADTQPKKGGKEGEEKKEGKTEGEGKEKEGEEKKEGKTEGEGKEKEGEEKKEGKTEGEGKDKKGAKTAVKWGGAGEGQQEDVFADTLTCIICQELLYDCVSLQPCMHSFCAGCYSEWMSHSPECPSCRGKVDRINKNHIVNNLVEAYLKEHPEKRRPEEDTKELDAKNKITRDMLYPKQSASSSPDSPSSPPYSDDDDEEEDATTPAPRTLFPLPPAGGTIFGFGTPLFGAASHAYRAVCRQCPGQSSQASGVIGSAFSAIKGFFTGPQTTTATTSTTASTSNTGTSASGSATPSTSGNNNNNNNNDSNNNSAQPSTSGAGPPDDEDYQERDKKIMPDAPPYTCVVNQNHVLCQCCLQIFPDRRAVYNAQPNTQRPQQCTICYRAFCHAYWGCRKADCNGCLAKLEDMSFGRKVLPTLILDNRHESEIFMNYLDGKKLAVRDVLAECIDRMQRGEYTCQDQTRYNLTGQTPLCFACGLRVFKALAYQYRAAIPRDQLPDEVTARADCYWGKNCRTQHNKPPHAAKFNHICEQTRR